MRAEEIRFHLRQEPFIPLRICMSDGSVHEVHDPEYAYVTRREIVLGMDIGNEGVPEQSIYLNPIHVTRIEPVRPNGNGTHHRSS